jgi:hypothetical protein
VVTKWAIVYRDVERLASRVVYQVSYTWREVEQRLDEENRDGYM